MSRTLRFIRIHTVIILLALSMAGAGCRHKTAPPAAPGYEVEESADGLPVHLYRLTATIKAPPGEVEKFFIDLDVMKKRLADGDLDWIRIKDQGFAKRKLAYGDSLDVTVSILDLSLPCQMSLIKHDPGKEVWLLIITKESWAWLLFRIDIRALDDRSRIYIDAIGNARQELTPLNEQMGVEVARRIDKWISILQSEFDPQAPAVVPLEDGLRGELGKELFQAYLASIWIESSPKDVTGWLAKNSDTYMPELAFGGDCRGLTAFLDMNAGEIKCCPATYDLAGISGDLNTSLTWKKNGPGRTLRIYIQSRDSFGLIRFELSPESGGTRLVSMATVELPDINTPMLSEKMFAISSTPARLKKLAITAKQGVESAE